MTCCLTSPSHCLNYWWLITIGVLWHPSEGNSTANAQDIGRGREGSTMQHPTPTPPHPTPTPPPNYTPPHPHVPTPTSPPHIIHHPHPYPHSPKIMFFWTIRVSTITIKRKMKKSEKLKMRYCIHQLINFITDMQMLHGPLRFTAYICPWYDFENH